MRLKVAIVLDWLTVYSGAEKVVEQIINVFPDADIFSLIDFLPEEDRAFLKGRPVNVSMLQKFPLAKKYYRHYLPFMPLLIEQFDLSGYDLVVSSSHAVAKGVLTGPDQLHISYVHSPIRYAWDLQNQYLEESNLNRGIRSVIVRLILHYIRNFDSRSAATVDVFLSNSRFVGRRIMKYYRRESTVLYPPVDVEKFSCEGEKDEFFITASRLVPYKKIDLIVNAFKMMPDRVLYVIGDGPDRDKIIKAIGAAKNIYMLGYVSDSDLKYYMSKARAFVYAAEEDFGISPVEALAAGTPVIAFGRGGVTETVVDRETGLFFMEQSEAAICKALDDFDEECHGMTPDKCRNRAEMFSVERFNHNLAEIVKNSCDKFFGML